MSVSIPDPAAYARAVAVSVREGLAAYLDACGLLREALAGDVRAQRIAQRELSETASGLGMTMLALGRTLEEIGQEAAIFAPEEDPRLALPLVRSLAASLVLMGAASLAEVTRRPLADPVALQALAARPALARFLALEPGA